MMDIILWIQYSMSSLSNLETSFLSMPDFTPLSCPCMGPSLHLSLSEHNIGTGGRERCEIEAKQEEHNCDLCQKQGFSFDFFSLTFISFHRVV